MANHEQALKSKYAKELPAAQRQLESLRLQIAPGEDISLAEYVQDRWTISMETLYKDLGISGHTDTIQNLVNMPDASVRFLLPEIFRDAIRLGYRKNAMWSSLIAATQAVNGLEVTQPYIQMSDARPLYTGIAETIKLGGISYGQKSVKLRKLSRGISIPYEVRNFVKLNVVTIFLQDYGVQLSHGMDMLLLDTLINGDQADGSESAPVIGTANGTSVTYRDLLKPFLRMSRLGKNIAAQIGGEDMALDIMDLDEFKTKESGTTQARLNVKTPLPNSTDFYIHSGVPEEQVILVDPSSAIIKYDAQPLLVESEKLVSNQTEATYVSLITGFGNLYRDSRIIVDKSVTFASAGFPSYMDPTTQEQINFDQ